MPRRGLPRPDRAELVMRGLAALALLVAVAWSWLAGGAVPTP